MALAGYLELFLIGVATPLTAACVLPLYPAFVGYLASLGERAIRWRCSGCSLSPV